MAHELLRGKHAVAVQALNALVNGIVVDFGTEDALAFPEAFVVDPEARGARWVLRLFWISMKEGVAEPFSVRFGDETAARGSLGEDALLLECVQLFQVAAGTEDVQLVADGVDVVQDELVQDCVEDLG